MKKNLFICLLLVLQQGSLYAQNWSSNIANIVYTKCTQCHRTGNIAPFALENYQQTYNMRFAIQTSINAKRMPPYPPDLTYQRYTHERALTNNQLQSLNDWINAGAPSGDLAQAPTMPSYENSTGLGMPDVTLQLPTYTSTADSTDVYRVLVVPTGFTETKKIKAIEIVAGNSEIVHHVLVFEDVNGVCKSKDEEDLEVGYRATDGMVNNLSAVFVAGWAPGSNALIMPTGMSQRIHSGADLAVQIHFPRGTIGQSDNSKINIYFAEDTDEREVLFQPLLIHTAPILTNGPLFIPANETRDFHEQFIVEPFTDYSVLAIMPHMHMVGRTMEIYARPFLSNSTIPLIKIDNWDFSWQGIYTFRQPIKLERATSIHAYAHYDNTTNNPNNPNNPPRDVRDGEATTDEMMLTFVAFTKYESGDENIWLEDTTTLFAKIEESSLPTSAIKLYPNPANNLVHLQQKEDALATISIYDVLGKLVKQQTTNTAETNIDISTFAKGVYTLQFVNSKGNKNIKFVKE